MVLEYNHPDCETTLVRILLDRGVAIVQCDTIYGFVGVAPETERRINKIKGRQKGKPYLQLIPSKTWIPLFSDFIVPSSLAVLWPGPLTLIIPGIAGGTIGLRVPDDPFLQKILMSIQKPLYSTSVNREGEKPMSRISEIIAAFEQEVDIIVHSGDSTDSIPSTIVDLTSSPYRIIRQGSLVIPRDIIP